MGSAQDPIRMPFQTPPAEGAAVEVAPGILWMRLPLPMALDHVNIYALDDGDGWTVIDTGMSSRRSKAIWQALLVGPLGGKPVRRLVVTHHHPDHVGLAGWFQTELGAELLTSRTAWLMARMLVLDEQALPTPEAMRFYRAAGTPEAVLAKRSTERPFNFCDMVDPMPQGYTRLAGGDRLSMGGRDWIVRTGNGHAPEHLTFWSADGDLVIAGDQILPGISPNLGVYPSEPEADPVGEWLESCTALKAHATEAHLVLPGHKLPFTGLPARLGQLIDNHHGALERLRSHLATPRSAVDCFPALFRREIGEAEFGLALVEAVAHLNHLHRLGQAAFETDMKGARIWQATDACLRAAAS
ncbi:MBL fold metallo-hydrolase [Oceanomicrobium pacificus]|uniref:MBL fold metallo-hydrolase n=1 Tax=Oceanomicrobium pacificus TaxID=2692916 RepID=A0A6B0TS45_9RHOB|nr:MBL fold metallo-hydrolase [Oceanomicrobium pacificus]MXU66806.1 MBL fold metallo-hydrolase [Oceanomicrobium pacificus]